MGSNLSRRSFVFGATTGGMLLAAGLSGCSTPSNDSEGTEAQEAQADPEIVAEHSADIIIVGSGTSGLAAAVEAGIEGISCIVVEKAETYGGNSSEVSGILAASEELAKEQGQDYTLGELVQEELEYSNYRTDGALWSQLFANTQENFEWLKEQGVLFSDVVDKDGAGHLVVRLFDLDPEKKQDKYMNAMYNRAVELGIEFSLGQTATKLKCDTQGNVVGVFTENADGDCELFSGKAVILASGGYAANPELAARAGWGVKANNMNYFAIANNAGSSYIMSMEIGAGDTIANSANIMSAYIQSLGDKKTPGRTLATSPNVLWVNESGLRFVNEDYSVKTNVQAVTNPLRNTIDQFVVCSRDVLEVIFADYAGYTETFDEVLASNPDDIFSGETIEEVAEAAGLDAETLSATFARYNEIAASGKDSDFNKDSQYLLEMKEGPFYIARLAIGITASFGGIKVNRNYEVVDSSSVAIPGLYAIGCDGCDLYRDTYTYTVTPLSACAHHVNSGRHSVMNAAAYMQNLS